MRDGVVVLPNRWKTDAVPRMSPEGAQGVINKQLFDKAGIVVALFHRRLGRQRRPLPGGDPAFGSWQPEHTAHDMAVACGEHGLRRSMGDTGICSDNAGAESLWSSFKHEHYYRHVFATKAELIAAVDNWMNFYNHERRHSAIGMRSPINYEYSLKATPESS